MAEDPSDSPSATRVPGLRRAAALFPALLLILVIPFLRVANEDLWVDEVMTHQVATASFPEHLELVYLAYDHPPLFFHLLWLAARASSSPAYLGMFPAAATALAGMVLAGVLWFTVAAPRRVGAIHAFAVLFALCPELCFQAWNLRHYGLFLLVGSAYLACWTAVLKGHRGAHRWSAFLAGAGLLTHHFMLFPVIAAEIAGALLLHRERRELLRHEWRNRLLIVAPLLLLWVGVAWLQYPGSGGERIAGIMNNQGVAALREMWWRYHGSPDVIAVPRWLPWAALGSGLLLSALDCLSLRRSTAVDRFWFVVAYAPVVMVLLLSYRAPALTGRMLLVSCGALMVVHARALTRIGRWGIVPFAAAATILVLGFHTHWNTRYHYPDYAEYIPGILTAVQPGEVLVLPPGSEQIVYHYYAQRAGIPMPPTIALLHPVADEEAFRSAMESLPLALAPYHRAWVVYEHPQFWDPTMSVQKFFESQWTPGPYQPLWERRWVVTYYDRPLSAGDPSE